jgi:hypothetical protein
MTASNTGVRLLEPHSPKIVIFGVSCSGKTTLARLITTHAYTNFDALFHWHALETLGASIDLNLQEVRKSCIAPKFVLDGWHLADPTGEFLPIGSAVYVVYTSYLRVSENYQNRSAWRGYEKTFWQHAPMFHKWYFEVPYHEMTVPVRYFENLEDEFAERDRRQYDDFLERNRDLPYP